MKKVLFATTALVLSAGVASADVKMGGFGYAGISSTDGDTAIQHAARLTFSGSTQTDGGISLSAFGRFTLADNADNAAGVHNNVTISSGAVRVTLGATHGAMRNHARVASFHGFNNGGILAVDNTPAGTLTDGGNNVYVRYTAGALAFGVASDVGGDTTEVGVSYSADGMGFGVGMSSTDAWMANASFTAGAITAAVGISSADETVLSATYTVDSLALNLAYENNDTMGVQATYGLGGGANLIANAGQAAGVSVAGLGVQFSF